MSTDPQCRICFSTAEENNEPLFTPCNCKGTIEFVHKTCLATWRQESQKTECENCKYPYNIMKRKIGYPLELTIFIIFLVSYILYIILCHEISAVTLPFIHTTNDRVDNAFGLNRTAWYKSTRKVFKIEVTYFSKTVMEWYDYTTRAGFVLWLLESFREAYSAFRNIHRFNFREKINNIMRAIMFIGTFPAIRPSMLGDQKYWVIFVKFLVNLFIFLYAYTVYCDIRTFILEKVLKLEVETILDRKTKEE